MLTADEQRNLVYLARCDKPQILAAIHDDTALYDFDKKDLTHIVEQENAQEAFLDYCRLDTIVRDIFMQIVQDVVFPPQEAAGAPHPSPTPFSHDELELLSDALISAIQRNHEAAKLAISKNAVSAINQSINALSCLNSKICRMIEDRDNNMEVYDA